MADSHLAMAVRMRRQVRNDFKPVEPGVTGKEKLFQENRNFGPGPIIPYPQPTHTSTAPITKNRMGDGVYRGRRASRARRV